MSRAGQGMVAKNGSLRCKILFLWLISPAESVIMPSIKMLTYFWIGLNETNV